MDLSDYREQYTGAGLDVGDLAADPLVQFQEWFAAVEAAGYYEPNAMVLSTVTDDDRPAARAVLLKWADERGFVFFTNFESDKGLQLATRPRASLTFLWTEVRRQIRVDGRVSRLPDAESDAYFASRPRGSQIGAWASDQSSVVADRAVLDRRQAEVTARYEGVDVPRPPHWGGYVVEPHMYEFWQGRTDRLHDRFRYRRGDDGWMVERLAP